jgi:hypothetical protein
MSAKHQKDKRTKEQILRLLDNAIEQEERLSEKIKSLESELADCRKKAENPRHELTDEALPASKVSFRIDYYRTTGNGPLKGIIEHLPSRQNKAFEGEGQLVIGHFMNRFLSEENGNTRKKKPGQSKQISKTPANLYTETDVEKTSVDTEAPSAAVATWEETQQEAAQAPKSLETPPPSIEELESGAGESKLMRKLKMRLAGELGLKIEEMQMMVPSAPKASKLEEQQNETLESGQKPLVAHFDEQTESRPSLMERLREELQRKLERP